ncbi:MAG: nucleoside triphosphate pyrophosphohydrolase [Clostridia bacterium]|nr:nucleoside triphosphate pyrophosphohydrolase [Clostridia bacterium]
MELMYHLRAPGGCPWDAEQTHKSLRSSLIEESYEVLDALDRDDMAGLEEELGDLLLQVVFHAVIEEERSEFTMRDVTTGIVNKLIYRHPHVFGDVHVRNSDDVLFNWENLKQKEKHLETVADTMRSVPAAFPALMRSYKIQKKAAHVGFDWPDALTALPKVAEEAEEVREAALTGDKDHIYEEIGDLLFACVNVARLLKIDPELALGAATDKFMRRFIAMEELIAKDGRSLSGMTLEEMDAYWDTVKKSE